MDQREDREEEVPPTETTRGQRVEQQTSDVPSGPSAQQHKTQLDSIFMNDIVTFVKNELKKIQKVLNPDYPECSKSQRDEGEVLEGEDEEQRRSIRWAVMKITLNFLRKMKQEELADRLQSKHLSAISQHQLKSGLKKKFQCVFEGIGKAGDPTLLNQVYTELYITEGGTGEVNDEHEVRQIETASRKTHRPETIIRQEDIFKVPPGRDQPIRTVMTKGVASIGKTVSTQKFTLDWAEDKAHQNIQFIFPFTFRELNVLNDKKFSLVKLIHHFFNETKEICSFENFQVLFIFDGLDESRLPLDFHNKEILTDATESTSVDVLLTNLIRGKLLPSALLWITIRPAAANQIPPQCVGMVTEITGFTDPQKEEYFRKRFRDEKQASKIISHMKTSQSLHIMCHIPVFCWITATVLEDVLETREGGELPSTLTEMYIHFLVVQTKVKKVKYDGGAETDPHWSPARRNMIESLGKLAFDQLQKGNLIFNESDLTECGIHIREASVYSGEFTQIFREERGLYQDKVFCFVHLSVQEFLAALYVHLTFINSSVKIERTGNKENQTKRCQRCSLFYTLNQHLTLNTPSFEETLTIFDHPSFWGELKVQNLHQRAVDLALESTNGHLDLFLRFLLGLSLQTNQTLLQGLVTQIESISQTSQDTIQYTKKKISQIVSPEKSINLFHCLNELNDRSLVEDIQQSLSSGSLSTCRLSPAHWSALGFIFASSEEELDVFDLKKCVASQDVFLRLLPVVKASNKALLSYCNLSKRSYEALTSVLSSPSCSLKELDLSNNNLQDSGVELLSVELKSPNCKLATLSLSGCKLSQRSFVVLTSVLSSQSCRLTELDLSNNNLQDSLVELFYAGLESSNCKLTTLRLSYCKLSKASCVALSLVLRSPSWSLRELDLSHNDLQDLGANLIFFGLNHPNCKLTTLRLSSCYLSKMSCEVLAQALSSPSCSLTELDLSHNDLQDSAAEFIYAGLKSPNCKLATLRLSDCKLSERSCIDLTSVLSSSSCSLTELDLSHNDLQDSSVELLYAGLESSSCKLTTLWVEPAGVQWLAPCLRKYSCQLTIDTNAASRNLQVSEDNRKVTCVEELQSNPDPPDKLDRPQLLCTTALTGRCYWEVEWRGSVDVSVSCSRIHRDWRDFLRDLDQCWTLRCSDLHGFSVWRNDIRCVISSSVSNRVAVYVDSLIRLHTFKFKFTEPLHPGFSLWLPGSSVFLC